MFRLAFSKDSTVSTTAGATVRHLVSAVYDRAAVVAAAEKKQSAVPAQESHTRIINGGDTILDTEGSREQKFGIYAISVLHRLVDIVN